MTTNHIDQLAQWWETAEVPTSATLPNDGDRIIIRYNPEWYEIATADGDAAEHDISADTRILSRAPKPKPAWHDALAVIARYENSDTPQTFLRAGHLWIDRNGSKYMTEVLRDVTPLIEAKVTDERVKRAFTEYNTDTWRFNGLARMRHALTAALGLETE